MPSDALPLGFEAVHHEDVIVATLGSGSRGNCTYIGDGSRGVLIDCGFSARQIFRRLDAIGLGGTRIEAVLVTHEHWDHVGAARVLDNRLLSQQGEEVPFYMTPGTASGLHPNTVPRRIIPIRPGQAFQVCSPVRRHREILVEPVTVPHDTRDPVSFTVSLGGARAGVITDLGRATRLVEQQLASLDIAVVEFNHDLEMLLEGRYSWSLKQRVRGPHGHLSNDQAGELIRRAASRRLRHLVLAHLSQDNNTQERAWEAAHAALHLASCGNVDVHIARQQTPLTPLRIPCSEDHPAPPSRPWRRSEPRRPPDDAGQISLF